MLEKLNASNNQFLRIILLGVGLLFLYAGFGAFCNIQEVLLLSIKSDNASFEGNLFVIQTILAVSGSLSTFSISFVITLIGVRFALLCGAVGHLAFVLSYLYPSQHLIYFCSVVNGFSGALLSISRSVYISQVSHEDTIVQNLTILQLLMNLSMFPGNLFVFFQFEHIEYLDKSNRQLTIIVLVLMMLIGIFFMYFVDSPEESGSDSKTKVDRCSKSLEDMALIFCHKDFIPLYAVILSLALVFVLGSNVGASIGLLRNIGPNPKKYVPLSGIAFGIGSFIGGLIPFLFKKEQKALQLQILTVVGYIVTNTSLWVLFLSFPNSAFLSDTLSLGIVKTNFSIILSILLLLGIGDFCVGLALNTIISTKFGDRSETSFAVSNISLSAFMALFFYGSTFVRLYTLIATTAILMLVATASLLNTSIYDFKRTESREKT